MEEKIEKSKSSKIVLANQNTLTLTGITKVLSSTEKEISVVINQQTFCVDGQNLTVSKLDIESGVLEANGEVFGMRFLGHKKKENFFKRIFG